VIAETTELPTKFAKTVVIDDQDIQLRPDPLAK
jgi:hypothetical protein